MCWLCNFRSQQLADGEVADTPFQFVQSRSELPSPIPSQSGLGDVATVPSLDQATTISKPPTSQ